MDVNILICFLFNVNCIFIFMLTAYDTVLDVVKGLDLGSYDYLTKPFSFAVLLARLRAASRRQYAQPSSHLRVADLVLNRATREVFRGRREIKLTATEFRLLEFLMRRPGVVVSRNAIVEAVWGFDDEVNDNTVDAFIRLVRRKVDDPHDEKLIRTVRGVGYSLRASA
jgi:DNA-binding response OmpR family regulator